MDVHATVELARPAADVFVWVDDLDRYPQWTSLVHKVVPSEPEPDGAPAWIVELRARVGPMARSKRLRMVRTVHDAPNCAVFERRELDGRHHSPWILTVELDAADEGGTTVGVDLHYGGGLWTGGLLERALSDQITDGSRRLDELVSGRTR